MRTTFLLNRKRFLVLVALGIVIYVAYPAIVKVARPIWRVGWQAGLATFDKPSPDSNGVTIGAVLSRLGSSPYDTIIIDKGTSDGVREGARVMYDNVILGHVSQALDTTSKIELLSSPGSMTDVMVGNPPTAVVAEGQGGGNFFIKMPHGVAVAVGDIVTLPGSAGIIVGVVGDVKTSPSDPFQKVLVASPLNLRHLRWVELVK